MSDLDLAVIGNCQIAALLDRRARIVWACVPRFDGDPTFCSLLSGTAEPAAGFADVDLTGFAGSEQTYLTNTAIVETVLRDTGGGAVKLIDFAPRFQQHRRSFRPMMLVRIVVPLAGRPIVRLRVRPLGDYGAVRPATTCGSNHIRYLLPGTTLRLTTDVSITALLEERAFVLDHPIALVLGPDETLVDAPGNTARQFLAETQAWWEDWVRGLSIPFEWQDAVIRAAITLKLCTFEDTGAVIAGITTSIPEAPDSGRNWDYRYCWLRDAYFVVHALNRLGATGTMEQYLRYIINVATDSSGQNLQPARCRRWPAIAAWGPCASATRPTSNVRTSSMAPSFLPPCSTFSIGASWRAAISQPSNASSAWASRPPPCTRPSTPGSGSTAAGSVSIHFRR